MIEWFQFCAVTGTILSVVALLLRNAFNRCFPRRVFVLLFSLSVFSLLIPLRISSPTSVYNIMPVFPGQAARGVPIMVYESLVRTVRSPIPGVPFAGEIQTVFMGIWIAISIALTAVLFGAYALSYYRLRDSTRIQGVRAFWGALCKVWVYKSYETGTPLVAGFIFPRIILPASLNFGDTKFIDYIIEHELTHIRRFDNILKFATVLAVCLHWYNPVVWLLFRTVCKDIEFSCDEAVLGYFGAEGKKNYAQAMLNTAEQLHASQGGRSTRGVFVMFGENRTKDRIENIIRFRTGGTLSLTLAALMIFCVSAVFATDAVVEPSAFQVINPAISPEVAERIAFAKTHGGVLIKLEFRVDKYGDVKYDVDILNGEERHKMDIDAVTGEIEEYSHARSYLSNSPLGSVALTRRDAENIALARSGGGTVTGYKLDAERSGRVKHDVNVEKGDMHYEFKIDANTGEIFNFRQLYIRR